MIYRKQLGYDSLKCIADKCPKSCCIGWQIMIDDDSQKRYSQVDGDFGERLKASINYSEGCFKQHDTRCAMLNANGLCDLQSTLGEEQLCYTCKMFPRHVEEFQDIREYSLSLACPEAARMVLSDEYQFGFTNSEDDVLDDPDEFDDFDFMLFDQLEFARDKMLEIAKDASISLQERMNLIACMALRLQELYDEGEILEMDQVDGNEEYDASGTGAMISMDYCIKSLDTLLEMEVLENSWTDFLNEVKKYWQKHSTDFGAWKSAMYPDDMLSHKFQNVFEALLFTYFCGSVYDGQIYARAMIAVQSTRWLMMMHQALEDYSLEEILYLFSREVEHSDINVNTLITYFESEL
ncbi:MAG: flagellin lysine-N-methylase [Pseudobutyrivibrio sp.]|nr:flagellin lysine-N-methylase [Pseudobutyrivibrio sp.]